MNAVHFIGISFATSQNVNSGGAFYIFHNLLSPKNFSVVHVMGLHRLHTIESFEIMRRV